MDASYADSLESENWKAKRKAILARDKYNCQKCGKTGGSSPLQVHHKCYRWGNLPWEYPNEDLITLCKLCHKKVHEVEKIPVFDEHGMLMGNARNCDRCNGLGYIESYRHVQNGVCFKCHGAGYDLSGFIVRDDDLYSFNDEQ